MWQVNFGKLMNTSISKLNYHILLKKFLTPIISELWLNARSLSPRVTMAGEKYSLGLNCSSSIFTLGLLMCEEAFYYVAYTSSIN